MRTDVTVSSRQMELKTAKHICWKVCPGESLVNSSDVVVLESGSVLESLFWGLGLASCALGLGLGLESTGLGLKLEPQNSLGLGLESTGLGLKLEPQNSLGLGLGLESTGLGLKLEPQNSELDSRSSGLGLNNLTVSSKKCIRGIFVRVGMESTKLPCDIYPFVDKIYFTVAIVDPRFSLRWISVDVSASSYTRKGSIRNWQVWMFSVYNKSFKAEKIFSVL